MGTTKQESRVTTNRANVCGHSTSDQFMEPADPFYPFRKLPISERFTRFGHQTHIVMGLSPIIAYKDHHCSFHSHDTEPGETPDNALMEKCSTARHPMSAQQHPSPTSRGTISAEESTPQGKASAHQPAVRNQPATNKPINTH